MRADDDLARFIEPVARALLGDPNPHLSNGKSLRFGKQGSMAVDLEKGIAYSHEENVGGGVLWLLQRERKLEGKAAFDFMRGIGCDIESSIAAPPPRYRITETYDYTDESGKLLFHVCRMEAAGHPKKFAQRAPDGSWKIKGIRQVPYRLPELIEAIAEEKTIFIVEGEKDADNLARWNIPATTNAGGAGKWHDDFAALFRGADVVVVPDNDKAGRGHADMVAASLADVASRVRYLALPDLPAKGDVSDLIESGATAEAFHALVERAPIWAPSFASKFGGQRWEQIGIGGGQVGYSWLIEDIIPMGEITLAFGDSGTGKSFNCFDLAMCPARGEMFNGRNVEPGLVIYIAAEAGKGFAKRKLAYATYHNVTGSVPFFLLTKRPDFFNSDEDCDAIIGEIEAISKLYAVPLVLIVLDTLSALAPGMNENASQDVSKVRARLVRINERFNAAMILVHHKPKGGSTPRGHGSLTADFETTIEFETDPTRTSSDGLPVHRATVRKQREGKKGENWEFVLPVVEVGKNKWGNPETSCVVTSVTSTHRPVTGWRTNRAETSFLEALFEALLQAPTLPPPGLPEQITKAADLSLVRSIMKQRVITGDEDNDPRSDQRFRTAFSRAGNSLKRYGVIGYRTPLVWYTGKPLADFKSSPEIA